MIFEIRSSELVFDNGDTWEEHSDPLAFDSTLSAALYARKHDWGGVTWEIRKVNSMTGAVGPWEYFLAAALL